MTGNFQKLAAIGLLYWNHNFSGLSVNWTFIACLVLIALVDSAELSSSSLNGLGGQVQRLGRSFLSWAVLPFYLAVLLASFLPKPAAQLPAATNLTYVPIKKPSLNAPAAQAQAQRLINPVPTKPATRQIPPEGSSAQAISKRPPPQTGNPPAGNPSSQTALPVVPTPMAPAPTAK